MEDLSVGHMSSIVCLYFFFNPGWNLLGHGIKLYHFNRVSLFIANDLSQFSLSFALVNQHVCTLAPVFTTLSSVGLKLSFSHVAAIALLANVFGKKEAYSLIIELAPV